MNPLLASVLCLVGLALVIYSAEMLVQGIVGVSLGFGVSAFVISVVFVGFDPENLAVGVVGTVEQTPGIALGSVIGAAMVAAALALGTTALWVPLRFADVPKRVLVLPLLAVALLAAVSLDGQVSRLDGAVLLAGFLAAVLALFYLSQRGLDIRPRGEVAETLEKEAPAGKWPSLAIALAAMVGIVIGSEVLVAGSKSLIARLGLSETFFGMVLLALAVSIEELAKQLAAALQGRPEISFGNVVGSVLAFFLCNAGIIALVRPIPVNQTVLHFYLPLSLVTMLLIDLFLLARRQIARGAGAVLVGVYLVFVVGGYLYERAESETLRSTGATDLPLDGARAEWPAACADSPAQADNARLNPPFSP